MPYRSYQFLSHNCNRFWSITGRGRRLVTVPTGRDWNSLLRYDLPAANQPYTGYEKDAMAYPGGYPPYTRAQWLASLGTLVPLPALPMYKDEYETLLSKAQSYLGCNYVWGGKTPPYFDCSGFIGYVYKSTGFLSDAVVSYTGTLWRATAKVDTPYYGDMVFWKDPDSGTPDGPMAHVAMFLGNIDDNTFWTIDCSGAGVSYRRGYRSNPEFYGFYRVPRG